MTGTPLENIAMQAEIAADGEPSSAEIDSTASLPAPGLFLLSRDFETSSYKRETERSVEVEMGCRGE